MKAKRTCWAPCRRCSSPDSKEIRSKGALVELIILQKQLKHKPVLMDSQKPRLMHTLSRWSLTMVIETDLCQDQLWTIIGDFLKVICDFWFYVWRNLSWPGLRQTIYFISWKNYYDFLSKFKLILFFKCRNIRI